MIGREFIAAAAEGLVVGDVGAALPQLSRGDVIGKEPGQPERVVAEMHQHPEAALTAGGLEVLQDVHEIVMPLIIVPVDAPRAIAVTERHEHRRQVVGEVAIIDATPPQRMPHHHVEEEVVGRHQQRAHREQPLGQLGIVEQDVGALALQAALEGAPAGRRPAAEQQEHEVEIVGAEAAPGVRSYHRFPQWTQAKLVIRVLHLASGREWRGGERQVWFLARALAQHPVDQALLTSRGSELARRVRAAGVRVIEVEWDLGLDPTSALRHYMRKAGQSGTGARP